MIDRRDVRAIVFDMGGVFLIPHPEPIGAILDSVGVDPVTEDSLVRRAHYTGVRALTDELENGAVQETVMTTWASYDAAYFSVLGVPADRLEAAGAERNRQRAERVSVWRYELGDNIDAFHRLARSGLPVAIVTNNDGTAAQQLVDHGICQLGEGPLPTVEAIVDSTIIGVAKPDPAIFAPALAALAAHGIAPGETLYVGDTVHADVHGGEAAGMAVVQLDPFDLHDDHDHHRMPDLVMLADHLLGHR